MFFFTVILCIRDEVRYRFYKVLRVKFCFYLTLFCCRHRRFIFVLVLLLKTVLFFENPNFSHETSCLLALVPKGAMCCLFIYQKLSGSSNIKLPSVKTLLKLCGNIVCTRGRQFFLQNSVYNFVY